MRGGGDERRAAERAPGAWLGWLLPAGMALALLGCGAAPKNNGFLPGQDGGPRRDVDVSRIPDAVPRHEPRSRYGNPASYVVAGRRYHVMDSAAGYRARGIASWYGSKFHGRATSSGEPYNMYAMTAAHKELPLPTYVQVRNLSNGRTVVVRVNDRGPFHPGRIIDLSYAAAKKLDIVAHGTAPVEVVAIDPYRWRGTQQIADDSAVPPETPADVALWLQVGAFASRGNAERLRDRLTGDFGAIQIHEGGDEGQPIYRVRIGPFNSVHEVDLTHSRLGRFGISGATLVMD